MDDHDPTPDETLPPDDLDALAPEEARSLREIKLAKLKALQDAGRDPFRHVRWDRNQCAAGIEATHEQLAKDAIAVSLAGRIMSRREHGKAGFADLQDESGRIQLYFKKDIVGEESFEAFKDLDLGDIVGVKGTVFVTRTGQVTVQVAEWALLAKILQALPEKWHGLTDIEQRFRQRYADMIVNRDAFQRIRRRSKAVAEIRRFLDQRGFLEVETPLLHSICGGATAEPFVTHWNALKADYYLRIAIELHLKRLIVGGLERVYEIGRVFRNEGLSTRHNPEFTMLELYWAYTDYTDIMQLTEDLIVHLATSVFKTTEVEYGEHKLNLKAPFRRMTFDAALREYAGCGLAELKTLADVQREAARLGLHLPKDGGYEKSLDEIWKEVVEPHLVQPTFITDFPLWISPLAKRIPPDDLERRGYPRDLELCYRFELFIATMEIAPSFSELNDPLDQRERMEKQVLENLQVYVGYFRDVFEAVNKEASYADNMELLMQTLRPGLNALIELTTLYITHRTAEADYLKQRLSELDVDSIVKLLFLSRAAFQMGKPRTELRTVESLRPMLEDFCSVFESSMQLDALRHALDVTRFDQRVDDDFINALEYAMPPTGGLGIGIDRLIMVLSGTTSIREVIAFPQLRQR